MTRTVPAHIVALLPRYVDNYDDSFGDDCDLSHDVDWADNLVGCCRDCGTQFDPDDVQLTEEIRTQVERASWVAGLIRAVAS